MSPERIRPHYLEFVEEDREDLVDALRSKAFTLRDAAEGLRIHYEDDGKWDAAADRLEHRAARMMTFVQRLEDEQHDTHSDQFYRGTIPATVLQSSPRTVPVGRASRGEEVPED